MFTKRKAPAANTEPLLTVLAVTTSISDRAELQRISDGAGWKIAFARDIAEAAGRPAPIVLCDRDLCGPDWRQAIQQLAAGQQTRKVILASYVADDYLWDEVIHCGGYDVLPKPFRENEVIHTIRFAWAAFMKSLPSVPHTK
jgi:FixJ family two-component response regulator